jgi:glycosyltransferase involved in cell wall biosynthesis
MNIWIIHHYANAPDAPGDARHFSHARELIRLGHKARIVACSFHHLTHRDAMDSSAAQWEERAYEGVPFTWIRAQGYQGRSFRRILNMLTFSLRAVQRKWAAGLEPPDVIMGSTPHPFAALAAQRLAAHYKVPFVLEVRDPWPYVLTEIGGYSRFHPFIQLVDLTMRFLYWRASAIVMFSGHSAPLLARYGADPRKIVWIPQGIDLEMCPRPQPAPDDGVFTVSYIGAHNQWNSLDAILDAAKLIEKSGPKQVLIRFVGDGDSKLSLIARAKNEKILNVRFDDPVPKKDIQGILHESDAFIMNNRKDEVSRNWTSFNKLYEYLAAGRPVIFGSWTENDPVSESGGGISVAAGDALVLAEAIRLLAGKSSEELARYGELGRSYIENHHSIPVLVNRFEDLIGAVTGRPLPRDSHRGGATLHA